MQMAAQQDMHNREVGERFKAEEDYQNWLRVKKLQRADQVREYRQILETQMQLQDVKKETDRRTSLGTLPPTLVDVRARPEGYSSPADPKQGLMLGGGQSSPVID